MITYRDGKQITICDGCYQPGGQTGEDARRGIIHLHSQCSLKPMRFRCPNCVTTGEEVCTHESS